MTTRWLKLVLRILLGVFFVVSAMAKVIAIDDFELYVFSFGFLSLDSTYLAVRLCIGVEMALGVMISLAWWPRITKSATLAMLAFFSLLMLYAGLSGRTDSCQCMGRLANLNPWQSLAKNIVIALLCYFVFVNQQRTSLLNNAKKRSRTLVTALAVVVSFVVPFVVSVPDSWMFGPEESSYNADLLHETVVERGLDKERYVLSMVTPGCPYCRMTRQKIGSILNRHHLDSTRVVFLEPEDIGTERFFKITYGQRPLVLLLDKGRPVTTFHYRNIEERRLADFLSGR